MTKILYALIALCFLSAPAYAQKTKAQMTTEINTNLPDNTTGAITPAIVRTTLIDLVTSYVDLNGSASFACSSHNFVSSGTTAGFTCSQPSFADLGITPTRAGDVIYWNGSAWVTLAGNNSGNQVLQENASGVPSWVTVGGTGTVTQVNTGFGASGGPITTTGTITVPLIASSSHYLMGGM